MWELEVRPLTALAVVIAIGVGALVAGRVTAPGPHVLRPGPATVRFEKVLTPAGMQVLTCQTTAVAESCLLPHGRP